MKWNLSPKETAGVAVVGILMGGALYYLTDEETGPANLWSVLGGATLIYTLGVVIGTNRPAAGFIEG